VTAMCQDRNQGNTRLSLFAICPPGLETLTAQELGKQGVEVTEVLFGGVSFSGSWQTLYRANLCLRTASRILLRLGLFEATRFSELRRKASHLAWERYIRPRQPVIVHAACHRSRLIHQRAVAERILGAIEDRLGQPVTPIKASNPQSSNAQLILVRLMKDQCVISMDSSGPLLHHRGYRQATAKAPLRETLAAGLLLASGWDGHTPLLDPFCGSGTIVIEAALMAKKQPPGSWRSFAFTDWPEFDSVLWESVVTGAVPQAIESFPPIIASDRDQGAVRSARDNALRANVLDHIEFSCRPISDVTPPQRPGWVVTNPPYGVRIGQIRDLRDLYAAFGRVLRKRCVGWNLTMLSPHRALERVTGLHFDEALSVMNGGLRVRLVKGRVPGRLPGPPKPPRDHEKKL
jgi:putative N6-adenine-specific DNA methylase